MGRMLIESVLNQADLTLTVALDRPGADALGEDAAAFLGKTSGVLITDDLQAVSQADCLIDFTRPDGTMTHLAICQKLGVKIVIGTTGFDAAQRAQIEAAGNDIAIVFAPNMSVGVNATLKLLDWRPAF